MKTSTILIGVGVLGAGAVAFYLYNKNKQTQSVIVPGSTQASIAPASTSSAPASSSVPSATKQTMWKDVEGNIWELTSARGKYGFNVKLNGSVATSQEIFFQAPDGYMIGADSRGSIWQYKGAKWNQLVKDNKGAATEYLAKYGRAYLNGLSGIGNAYMMS